MNTVLQEVDSWPMEEQLHLAQALWDRIVEAGVVPELSEAQKAELDRRLEEHEAHPEDVVSWDTVQKYVRRAR